MWGMETLKKLKQKAGSRETEPSAGAAPAQGAASSTAPDASPVSARQVLAKFASYYRPYTFLFVFDLVCATVLACVDLAFPQFLSFFTKDFFQSSPEAIIGSLWWIALLFVVLYGVRTACQYFITSWGHIMGARMEADMRMDLFKQYQRLSFSYYDRNNTGEMMSKLVTDLFDISELAHHGPENLFICILKIVGSFALLFLINVPLTAIMLVATLLLAAYSFWRNYQKRVIFTENRKKMADINARLQDSLGGIRVVKSFGNEPVEIKKFDRTNARFVATKESSYRFMGSFHAVNSLFIGVLTAYAFGLVGFVDDYIKVVKKRNLGLMARYKIVAQVLITGAYLSSLYLNGTLSTIVTLPLLGAVDFGWFFYVLSFLLIIGMVNAVNLTDGIDGLASSVTFVVMMGFMFIASLLGNTTMALFAAAVAGGCAGFLAWNFYPAKTFMGDTGSMFLGGTVVAVAYGIGRPELLLFMGVIYLIEAFSVMLQVTYFKLTHGKRIFKMSPIHHHFEMCGWSEVKIVSVFSFITLVGVVLGGIFVYVS